MDMVTIGDIKLDTFVQIGDASVQCEVRMPECKLCLDYGAKVAVESVESQVAGSAPNVAVGLSRLGFSTSVISNMGTDGTRALSLEHLTAEGVNTSLIRAIKGAQSTYSVVLNYQGDRTILTSHIKHDYRLPKRLPKMSWMYVCEMGDGYEDLYKDVVSFSKKHNTRIAVNPGSIQVQERKKELHDLIAVTDVLFVNVEEAQQITQSSSKAPRTLAHELTQIGAKNIVLTDGKRGAFSYQHGELYACPMFPGEPKDTTGAGDAFASGYIGAVLSGQSTEEALKWGSVNSASVVQYIGPQPGLLSKRAIQAQLKDAPASFKITHVT